MKGGLQNVKAKSITTKPNWGWLKVLENIKKYKFLLDKVQYSYRNEVRKWQNQDIKLKT